MKGLLLKDFYLIKNYCRVYFILILIMLGFSIVSSENSFFMVYPFILSAIIPITLFAYDEREKWCAYSLTLTHTKSDLVSAKYIIGLIINITIGVLTAIVQAVVMTKASAFEWSEYLLRIMIITAIGLIADSFLLPFFFRLGAEKGRIANFIIAIAACASPSILMNFNLSISISNTISILFILCATTILYSLSWLLSIKLYEKREL